MVVMGKNSDLGVLLELVTKEMIKMSEFGVF